MIRTIPNPAVAQQTELVERKTALHSPRTTPLGTLVNPPALRCCISRLWVNDRETETNNQ